MIILIMIKINNLNKLYKIVNNFNKFIHNIQKKILKDIKNNNYVKNVMINNVIIMNIKWQLNYVKYDYNIINNNYH